MFSSWDMRKTKNQMWVFLSTPFILAIEPGKTKSACKKILWIVQIVEGGLIPPSFWTFSTFGDFFYSIAPLTFLITLFDATLRYSTASIFFSNNAIKPKFFLFSSSSSSLSFFHSFQFLSYVSFGLRFLDWIGSFFRGNTGIMCVCLFFANHCEHFFVNQGQE